jgi:CRISPR-associated protein Cmr2
MPREYTAFECQYHSEEINEMISINNNRMGGREKEEALGPVADKIIFKNNLLTGKRIPPAATFYELKYQKGGGEKLRQAWINAGGQAHAFDLMKKLKLDKPQIDVKRLPEFSWLLTLKFSLVSPYTSQDDNPLYMLDNPLRREQVFGVPCISPSQWKGMLRVSIDRHLEEKAKQMETAELARWRFLLTTLFGDEQLPLKGSLCFFPTYFGEGKTSFEIVNPHSRETGAGNDPFHLEVVQRDASGWLTILYVPLYTTSSKRDEDARGSIKLVAQGLYDLFIYYGIGAKTSSGFGKVNREINGVFIDNGLSTDVHGEQGEKDMVPEEYTTFFDGGGQIKSIFLDSKGAFYSNKDYKKVSEKTGTSLNNYKRFRNWCQERGISGDHKGVADDSPSSGKEGYRFGSLEEMLEFPLKIVEGEG